ncbi:MAG: DUF192 domain-containing protein [Thermus sp.]|uniref:DUF192 domain-containing protein n=1 Tax=unclassified Thermus TaxID=2619321 RepID=UPI000238A0F1|nr:MULTISPECIES: DUF192 domain-containing protein [unclassified Thermus]AEV15610.1 hypothetical protein TCCBUS3UF1_5620 [Thermus sp. CCB_US3_UF1]MCS6868838.1 DUF192 domain-containing protein [Thermus sp.]MCS7218391.1 DUF192 domain-containing protein [Thermus sp.]MCX7849287.1 DUF192 domain-containing protein [Thermus sp.]MDW8016853.1 DUF192 domain-containing protein [Thermus sp.]
MERNPLFPLAAFALLILLSVFAFLGYLLAARRFQTPPAPQRVVVETREGTHSLRARLARTPEAWSRGLGVRQEALEALLYLFPQATDAPFSAEGYRFPVVVAFLDGEGRVLKVVRLAPGETHAPGTAYRGVLEVREGLLRLAPGDRVLP